MSDIDKLLEDLLGSDSKDDEKKDGEDKKEEKKDSDSKDSSDDKDKESGSDDKSDGDEGEEKIEMPSVSLTKTPAILNFLSVLSARIKTDEQKKKFNELMARVNKLKKNEDSFVKKMVDIRIEKSNTEDEDKIKELKEKVEKNKESYKKSLSDDAEQLLKDIAAFEKDLPKEESSESSDEKKDEDKEENKEGEESKSSDESKGEDEKKDEDKKEEKSDVDKQLDDILNSNFSHLSRKYRHLTKNFAAQDLQFIGENDFLGPNALKGISQAIEDFVITFDERYDAAQNDNKVLERMASLIDLSRDPQAIEDGRLNKEVSLTLLEIQYLLEQIEAVKATINTFKIQIKLSNNRGWWRNFVSKYPRWLKEL